MPRRTRRKGFKKIWRDVLDDPTIMKDAEYLAVWIYMNLKATHAGYDADWHGKRIRLSPGQVILGRHQVANDLHISESKVRYIWKRFKDDQLISQQGTKKGSLFSILEWELDETNSQVNDHLTANKQPSDSHLAATKQEGKESSRMSKKEEEAATSNLTSPKEELEWYKQQPVGTEFPSPYMNYPDLLKGKMGMYKLGYDLYAGSSRVTWVDEVEEEIVVEGAGKGVKLNKSEGFNTLKFVKAR